MHEPGCPQKGGRRTDLRDHALPPDDEWPFGDPEDSSKEVRMTRILGPTGSGRRRRTLLGGIVSLLLLALVAVPNAFAVHDLGLFELDRNAEDDPATSGDDWDTLFNGGASGGADLTAQPEASDDDITGYDADSTFDVTAPGTYVCTVVVDP
jgi:hypothetical protein